MKKVMVGIMCVAAFSLQGCFWHSSEVEHDTVPANNGSTTVVTPAASSTSSTVTTTQ